MALYNVDGIFHDKWKIINNFENITSLTGSVIIPLDILLKSDKSFLSGFESVGVKLYVDSEPEELLEYINLLEIICIYFPTFKDGRGFSLARILRDKYSFKGDLRAIGDVLLDQASFLFRVGFSTINFTQNHSLQDFEESIKRYHAVYQKTNDAHKTIQDLRLRD